MKLWKVWSDIKAVKLSEIILCIAMSKNISINVLGLVVTLLFFQI